MGGGFHVGAASITTVAHLLLIAITSLLLVWLLHFREGVAFFSSSNPTKIFNVSSPSTPNAMVAGVLGIIAVFKSKKEVGLPDMYTLHSWLGMSAICLFGLQYIIGFFSYVFPGAEMYTRASLLPWHRFVGMAIFLLAVGTAETGLLQYFQFLNLFRSQEALIVNFTALLLFLYAFFVALSVTLPTNYS
ncbi:hypothetical protein V8G54_017606 [Vigna mungo]|uniref:Cytochrome b561 domain-containing protein n=1 Tax=Vigna mungo TaxID=3915 RepID=A0AAQ3NNA0_VIGMU